MLIFLELLERYRDIAQYASAFLVFIGLYVIMVLVYKILSWSSDEAEIVREKLRLQIFGFLVCFSVWWLLLDLPPFPYQGTAVKAAWSLFLFFLFMLLLDIVNYLFFDIYYPRVKKTRIPQIVCNLIRGLYFVAIVLFILAVVLNVDIRPFLTGSAILTAIIGLALQDTLGNLFSGLALHISRPFNIGHWIKFEEIEGKVVRIDWRATTIKTREEDYMSIPNSQLAKVVVINYSVPTTVHGQYVNLGVRYEYPPNRVKDVLTEAAVKTDGVLGDIIPDIFLEKYNDFSVDYKMRFFIKDFAEAPRIKSSVMESIWYMFRRRGLEIPFPIQDVFLREEKEAIEKEELLAMLSRVDFLQGLNKEEIVDVGNRLKLVLYAKGEYIIKQGDKGHTFYILKSGKVKVIARNEEGEIFLTKMLEPGDFFGEISVLTGEPRTASIIALTDVELLMLNKDDFELMLRKYPDMDSRISEKIAQRQRHTFEQMELAKKTYTEEEARFKAEKKVESLSHQILSRIRNFFSIK